MKLVQLPGLKILTTRPFRNHCPAVFHPHSLPRLPTNDKRVVPRDRTVAPASTLRPRRGMAARAAWSRHSVIGWQRIGVSVIRVKSVKTVGQILTDLERVLERLGKTGEIDDIRKSEISPLWQRRKHRPESNGIHPHRV